MNFSLRFVRDVACALLLVGVVAGCGSKDGARERAEGCAALEVKDYKRAVRLLETGLEKTPNDVDALVALARANLAMGELNAASKAIAKAEENDETAIDVRLLSAQIAWHAKDFEKAARLFKGVAEDGLQTAEIRSLGWTGLGIVEMTSEAPHLARVAFLKAIRQDRRNASAWYHLGLLYREAPFGYNEAALEQFEFFVRLDTEASPRVQKTQNVLIAGLKDAIARDLTDRVGVSRRNSDACATEISKAETAIKKGMFKTARSHYEAAVREDVLSYPAALGLAKMILKLDNTKAGQQKALAYYQTACALRASAVSTFVTAGELAQKLYLWNQAVDLYSRALAANPSSVPALDGLIASLRRLGGRQADVKAYQDYRDLLSQAKKTR